MATDAALNLALEFLSTAYSKSLDPGRRNLYKSMLEDLSDDLLASAIQHVISTSKFFPAISEIRDAATELIKYSLNIPSSAEAWSEMVNRAFSPRNEFVPCEEYLRLKQAACQNNPATYWDDIRAMRNHESDCKVCHMELREYQFSHKLIELVARRLGWPDRFWSGSDEIGVDRGRFIKTYDAEISRMSASASMLPEVRTFIHAHSGTEFLPQPDGDKISEQVK
jgi:hypothetical protein